MMEKRLHPVPENDEPRLQALSQCRILDTPPEHSFDALTRLAARIFNVPIALVSLIDRDRQWFKSSYGLSVRETPRSHAFCAHAIMKREPYVVLDASADPLFDTNPYVTGPPFVRFYAGAQIYSRSGYVLGTFCIIDNKTRDNFLSFEKSYLNDFARTTEEILEMRMTDLPDPC